jgi:hypothetical protein
MIDLKEIETLKNLKNTYANEIYNLQKSNDPDAKNKIKLILETIHDIDEQISILSKTEYKTENKHLGLFYIVGMGILFYFLSHKGNKKR